MLINVSCVFFSCLFTLFCTKWASAELNSKDDEQKNATDEMGNRFLVWQNVAPPLVNTHCSTKGRSGKCVALGQCPILEQQVRNIIPALALDFLAIFTDACSFAGGYCCPELNSTPKPANDALWAWEQGEKKLSTENSIFDRQTEKTTKSWYNKPIHKPTETQPNRPKPTRKPPTRKPVRPNKPAEVEQYNHRNRRLLPENSCGVDLTSKILGGDEAEIGEFPWMALLRLRMRDTGATAFICGGSLISARYVISAAHCLVNLDLPKNSYIDIIRLGEHDTQKERDCFGNGECSAPVQDIPVESWKVHERYNPYNTAAYNDISLIRLARPAEFNLFVSPICLPLDKFMFANYNGKKLDTAGWGKTSNGKYGKGSTVKLKVSVPVVPYGICALQYMAREVELHDTQLCAGGDEGKDSCQGDSGGPLMYSHRMGSEFRYVLVGVVSTGPKECGKANNAAIYTKVAKYVTWILDNMRE